MINCCHFSDQEEKGKVCSERLQIFGRRSGCPPTTPLDFQEPASAASLLRPSQPSDHPTWPRSRRLPGASPRGPASFSPPAAAAGAGRLGFRRAPHPPAQFPVELEDTRSPGFFCGDLWCGLMEPKGELAQKPIEEAVQNLKIDAITKAGNVNLPAAKDASSSDAISCISSGDAASTVKETEMNQGTSVGDQGMYYYGYYYPGSFGGWDENGYYVGSNGLEMHPTVVQGDNGSYLCYLPGYENGYTSYSPVVPGAIAGVDGQYVSKEPYYSTAIPMQDPTSPGMFAQPIAYGPELVPAYTWDPSYVLLDGVQGHPVGVRQTNYPSRPNYSSNKHAVPSSKASRSTKSASSTIKGSSSALDTVATSANDHPSSKVAHKASGASMAKGHLPTSKFVVHTNQGKGSLYQSKGINLNESGRSFNSGEKLKARSKLNGYGDISNNRADNSKNSLSPRDDPFGLSSVGEANGDIPPPVAISKDSYNLPDFVTKYEQALFFVIKSYSEDDIHKSIKYNVWASTPNGNKRLDNAYKLAQERIAGKGTKCPVFLFFSVNASGQFCGVAEMVGPVDFNRNMNFWQQDKWNGFFPVKWHIIKDVPNPHFRHIILENNENKPVTNSRDTQEVKFLQGAEMLNIFKNFSCKTSILDDFDFYENRQKVMQDRRGKPLTTSLDHLMPKDEKPVELKKQTQSLSTVELETAKRNEEQINKVATDLDTAKRSEEQSNKLAIDLDTAERSEEQSNKVATDLDIAKRSEEQSNKIAADVDTGKRTEEQSNCVAAEG